MDDASLAALRLSIDVELIGARRDLQDRDRELTERCTDLEQVMRVGEGLRAERILWEQRLRALSGHTLTGSALRELHIRGEAIEARTREFGRREADARTALQRAERRLEEGHRAVGEYLARQRWIERETQRGRATEELRQARREDED